MTKNCTGTLFVVATPIGNLGDLSSRALEVLESADRVVAEDTRRTARLLAKHGVSQRLTNAHKYSEASAVRRVIDWLTKGETIALVTDGGTPGISDPGDRLVAAAHERGVAVVAIPGPCAAVTALSVSGFGASKFHFAGFLPARSAARQRALADLAEQRDPIVLYEAPHRVLSLLEDAIQVLGDRRAAFSRELTKLHEENVRAPLSEIFERLRDRPRVLGEIVLVIAPAAAATEEHDDETLKKMFRDALVEEEGDLRRAVRRVARDSGVPRAEMKRRLAKLL